MKLFICLHFILLHFNCYTWDIVSSKCEEYGRAVYVETESPVLTRNTKKNLVAECGIVSVPLIVGGLKATEKEFPHMAVIGFGASPKSKLAWNCGGSLISELFILTAAHCLESREMGPAQKIRLGIIYLDQYDPDTQERLVSNRISHPKYRPSSKSNDIGLIKMDKSVIFTSQIRPACLNTNDIFPGEKVLASGFGKLNYDAEHGSKDLMKVLLEIYSIDQCADVLSGKEQISDNVLCAGQILGGKDTCQGDSGGPLQTVLEKPYCMYNLIGITSFGKFCGFRNSLAIYTKISSFIPWIEQIVWK